MKKLIVFALCAISTLAVFAEPYSKAKANELFKAKNHKMLNKYCYESQVSDESNLSHALHSLSYLRVINGKNLTIQMIEKELDRFKTKITEEEYTYLISLWYANFGNEEAATKNIETNPRKNLVYYRLFIYYKKHNNYNLMWKYGKTILLSKGGFTIPVKAMNTLNTMFRYKPESITKEEQIEFLKQLSQIYPIPGTDFNKWKGFMGFVGFKYKTLTGKDLF